MALHEEVSSGREVCEAGAVHFLEQQASGDVCGRQHGA